MPKDLHSLSFPLLLALALFAASPVNADTPSRGAETTAQTPAALTLSFNGARYQHRWSRQTQHEFTPAGQEDLSRWQDMLTLIDNPQVDDDAGLRKLAETARDYYKSIGGSIVKTSSTAPATGRSPDYFVAAMLPGKDFIEVCFTRIVATTDGALVATYARRHYGTGRGEDAGAWMQSNGATVERELMAWTGLPQVARLQALPQSR